MRVCELHAPGMIRGEWRIYQNRRLRAILAAEG